jgi:hypothetical protein
LRSVNRATARPGVTCTESRSRAVLAHAEQRKQPMRDAVRKWVDGLISPGPSTVE